MKNLLFLLLGLILFSCQKKDIDSVAPEYDDWYVLKSPVDSPIEGVWGDYDRTLLISTGFNVLRSTDQGKNWESVYELGSGNSFVSGVVQYQDTLFTMHSMVNANYGEFLLNTGKYSVDDGKKWHPYRKYNPFFNLVNYRDSEEANKILRIDQVMDSGGSTYSIYRDFLDDPVKQQGRFETPGIISSYGGRTDLPQLHQLNSLYLDSKERLYVSGSDAVCMKGEEFSFCNSRSGRGVVYVSKRPVPLR